MVRKSYIIVGITMAALFVVAETYSWTAGFVHAIGFAVLVTFCHRLNKKIEAETIARTTHLKETEAALTETLQVVFGHLKKVSDRMTRLDSKARESGTRLHRLEQLQQQRVSATKPQRSITDRLADLHANAAPDKKVSRDINEEKE